MIMVLVRTEKSHRNKLHKQIHKHFIISCHWVRDFGPKLICLPACYWSGSSSVERRIQTVSASGVTVDPFDDAQKQMTPQHRRTVSHGKARVPTWVGWVGAPMLELYLINPQMSWKWRYCHDLLPWTAFDLIFYPCACRVHLRLNIHRQWDQVKSGALGSQDTKGIRA